MSERRSTEIKFRTTPSFKARVQAAAAAADKSMSEFLEECAETRMQADSNALLFSRGSTWGPIVELATLPPQNLNPILEPAFLNRYAEPDEMHPVSTSGEEGAKEEIPAPAEWQKHPFGVVIDATPLPLTEEMQRPYEVLLKPLGEPQPQTKPWMFEARG